MSNKFLSDEWFEKVAELTAGAGDLNVPESIAELNLNLNIQVDGSEVGMAMVGGAFKKGLVDDAPVTMTLPEDLAQRIFLENDAGAGMQGFMSGQIQVEGDMSQLMALQTVQPSAEQLALLKQIQECTA